MLTEMLKKNPTFQGLPEEQQIILARLAAVFEESTNNLFRSPEELSTCTGIGNRFQWATLLMLEPTQGYIKSQISQITNVMTRKSLLSLQIEAANGNVQAIKQIHELSGILAQEDTNKVIILHQISRPALKEAHSDEDR